MVVISIFIIERRRIFGLHARYVNRGQGCGDLLVFANESDYDGYILFRDRNVNRVVSRMQSITSFAQLFFKASLSHPDHPALVINNVTYTYGELTPKIEYVAHFLRQHQIKRLGILAHRSLEAYLGILAAHWVGAAYVPLNPLYPVARLKNIMTRSKADALMVDAASVPMLVNPELADLSRLPAMTALSIVDSSERLPPINPDAAAPAYILFTSGSTGVPKGVPVSFANLSQLLSVLEVRYDIQKEQRVAQYSTLSFDASVLDLCLAWSNGATMYVVPEDVLMSPAKFIQDNSLNVWFSVPSIINIMNKLHVLKPGCFPSLRYSFFSGEALTYEQAKSWQEAAPDCIIENLYGLTETTVECLAHRFNAAVDQVYVRGVVPIGKPFPETDAAIINHEYQFLSAGESGELAIAGPQIISSYWQDAELTRQKIVELDHPELGKKMWYLTGDNVNLDQEGVFHYLGRRDNQHKVFGNRVELEEIEYHLRKICRSDDVAVVITNIEGQIAKKINAVISQRNLDVSVIRSELANSLPTYMLPDNIIVMDNLPFSSSGKLDRLKLAEWLQNGKDIPA